MEISYYNPNELIAAEYNPRQLTKDQHKDLTDSIKRFGLVDPSKAGEYILKQAYKAERVERAEG